MKLILTLATAALSLSTLWAQAPHPYQLHRYDSTDGGILWSINDNGQWGTIRLGSTSAGGNATPKLYNVETSEAFEVRYQGTLIDVSDVSDDGNLVVGSMNNRPVAYNRATDQITIFPMRDKWAWGSLNSVTPDGKWAVGSYSGYTGNFTENDELSGDYYFSPLMVNIETGDTLALPGMPKLDMAHLDQHALVLTDITPDGRYAIGMMDWYIMQPISGFTFIYDTQEHNYRVVGFTEHEYQDWESHFPNMHHIESHVMSPNGRYLAGMAYMTKPQTNSEFFNEYGVPYRYDMETGEMTLFDGGDSNSIDVGAVTNNGTLFGNPDSGSPLRNFRVFYRDRFWISFSQICQQYFDFNFFDRTGYEYTGTVMGVSGDGTRFVTFVDPTGESYIFDLKASIDEVCSQIDLLSNYTVSPEPGSEFSRISNIEINFGRNVQIMEAGGDQLHLYTADGTLVANGLSNGALKMKTGSKNTVVATFRTRPLESGQHYEVVIEAGAIAVNGEPEIRNHEIRIAYSGRNDAPVTVVRATPENHSSLRQIDNSSSYILLEFDSPIKVTDNALAYLERVADGNRLAVLNAMAGITDETRKQLLLTPNTPLYLYAGEEYRLVLEAGSVSDYSGSESSLNERYEIVYHGTYVREVASETIMFADNFDNPNESLTNWMCFEGDHNTPTQAMQAWGFTTHNNPWNFTLHDTEGDSDYFAGSHSLYNPAAASDDWMITPQIAVPLDGRAVLEFDAQKYNPNRNDALKIYIYEDRNVLSYINTAIMNEIRQNAVLLDIVFPEAGANADLTAGEWTHYSYSLDPWAGKDIYIAFVNQNENQSALFVNNVLVQREVTYAIGFSNRDRVVGQESIQIAGQFTVLCDETEGGASLALCDGEGNELSRIDFDGIPTKGNPVGFAFDQPLPLTIGREVPYSIQIQIGQKSDVFEGSIYDLAFEPVKRVVLEEMTGTTCVNCPLGIVSVEQCEHAFGDRFIPVGIHSYTGDNLGSVLSDYSSFLGLNAAPMARVNRLPGTLSPMVRISDEFYYRDIEGENLWYDVVARELDQLASADVELTATLSQNEKQINFDAALRYAISASNQQLSLFIVILEDGVESYQLNGFSAMQSETLADWCNGGPYSEYAAYPFVHNHVARAIVGQTYSGTIGLFPSTLEGGVTYHAQVNSNCPASVLNTDQISAVAMLIDTQSGKIVNAIKAKVQHYGEGIEEVLDEMPTDCVLRTLSGTIIKRSASAQDLNGLPQGVYLLGNRKVMIK